jgi:MFS family permease
VSLGGALSPLRHRDFRRLWIAQTVSIVGDKVNQVALSIMVFRLTRSAIQMGIALAITFLPAALFGLLAGPLVDRWDHRRTMVTADLVRAVIVGSIPFAFGLGLPAVYVLVFLSSTVSLFFEPSRMALVPSIVGEDQLMAANALDMTTMSVSELLGIAFGGALVLTIRSAAFWVDGATFLVSAVFVLGIGYRSVPKLLEPLRLGAVWEDLKFGLGRIRHNGVLRGVVVTYAAMALCGGAAITLTLLLAFNVYISAIPDALRVTVVDIATTAGLLAGSMAVGMSGAEKAGRKYLWGIVVFGFVFVQFLWVPNLWVAAAVLFVGGVANEYVGVPMITMMQVHTRSDVRGRVFAVRTTLSRVAAVVGLLGAGLACQAYGTVPTAVGLGAVIVAVGALGFSMPQLRQA